MKKIILSLGLTLSISLAFGSEIKPDEKPEKPTKQNSIVKDSFDNSIEKSGIEMKKIIIQKEQAKVLLVTECFGLSCGVACITDLPKPFTPAETLQAYEVLEWYYCS